MPEPEMGMEFSWHSRQGQRTGDNRDCCGIRPSANGILCVVLDGSTTGPECDKLVGLIARDLIDWFVSTKGRVTADTLIRRLSCIQKQQAPNFHLDSASYVIMLLEDEKPTHSLRAGDCLVGQYDGDASVNWLTQPHTLANAINNITVAEVAASPLWNRISRGFRAREFMRPDVNIIDNESEANFVVATDGFWAGIKPDDYSRFLSGGDVPVQNNQDDCSARAIKLRRDGDSATFIGEQLKNMYFAASE